MSVVGLVMALTLNRPAAIAPVLWLNPKGELLVNGVKAPARLTPGAKTVKTALGYGLDLDGKRGGLLLKDLPALKLTGSITVSTWIYLRSYVNDGPGAQILFRGDDRSGFDCYSLCILSDGTIAFGIGAADGLGASVQAEIPLKQWVHINASFDNDLGELRLWLDNGPISYRLTARKPYGDLDAAYAPGVGIGNVQNDAGPHNQPLNGILADLKLYDQALDPIQTRATTQP